MVGDGGGGGWWLSKEEKREKRVYIKIIQQQANRL